MDIGVYLTKMANSLELDTTGLIKSNEQIAQEQQKAKEDALVEQGAGGMVDGMVANATAPTE